MPCCYQDPHHQPLLHRARGGRGVTSETKCHSHGHRKRNCVPSFPSTGLWGSLCSAALLLMA